jgi:murein L,D-transpeptidase YafK
MRINSLVILFSLSLACNGQHDSSAPAKENGIEASGTIKKMIPESQKPLESIIDSLKAGSKTITLVISKSKYELTVWADTLKLKTYPIVFGQNPVDDKLQQGDMCTPEGVFKIKSKYPHASWTKFIWFDYPNAESWRKHNEAKRKGVIPQNAKIGGEVGIHGVPKGCDYVVDNKQNWTWGCVSLKNNDINEIYDVVNKNTVVEIRK